MDVDNYIVDKEKGLIAVGKVGSAYFLSRRQFSPNSGDEITPQIEAISLEGLDTEIAILESRANILKQIKSDFLELP